MLKFFAYVMSFCFLYGIDQEEDPYGLHSAEHGFFQWNPEDFYLEDDNFDIRYFLSTSSRTSETESQQKNDENLSSSKQEEGKEQQKSESTRVLLSQEQPKLPEDTSAASFVVQPASSVTQKSEAISPIKQRKRRVYQCWSAEEHQQLVELLANENGNGSKIDWGKIAQQFADKDIDACMHRYYHKIYENPDKIKRKKSNKK